MSKIAPPDGCSAGLQTRLGRRFTPGRYGGSAIRQVWKPTLLSFLSLSFVAFPCVLAMRPLRT